MKLKYLGNSKTSIFTDDQQEAINGILQFLAEDFKDGSFIVSLCGPGGVGKTFCIDYIIHNSVYTPSVIMCAAPTHKACRNLSNAIRGRKVITIQSLFGFRLDCNIEDFDPNNPYFSPISNPKLTNLYKVLIIDESSMLNQKLVNYIVNYCRKLKIKVIFVGDDFQLAAPKDNKISSFSKSSKIFKLNQIVRQSENNPIRDVLDIMRNDIEHKTFDFLNYVNKKKEDVNPLNNTGWHFIDMNTAANLIKFKFSGEEFQEDVSMYKIVSYKNIRVTSWNNFVRKCIIPNSAKSILTKDDLLMSYSTIVDDFNSIVFANSEEYIVHDIVDTVDSIYNFKGFLVRFQQVYGGDITPPIFVINHVDNYTWQYYCKVVSDMIDEAKRANNHTRSGLWKKYFEFKKRYLSLVPIIDIIGKIISDRDLDYGFAISAHKSQGSTYGTVFVDLKDMIYDRNNHPFTNRDDVLRRIYVACSRPSKELYLIW